MQKVTNEIKTTPIKGLVIFTAIMFLTSLGFFIGFLIINENLMVKIIILVVMGIFMIVSGIVLYDQLFNYVKVKDGMLIVRFYFTKKSAKIENITSIRAAKDAYEVLVKEKKFCTLSPYDPVTQKMLFAFEKYGVDISKINKI